MLIRPGRKFFFNLPCRFAFTLALTFPPHDRNKVYVMDLCGVGRSADNGKTWSRRNGTLNVHPKFFNANTIYDSLLYYGGYSTRQDSFKIYTSRDEGLNWQFLIALPSPTPFAKVDLLARGNTLLVGTSKETPSDRDCGIYRSTDHGASWAQVLSSIHVYGLTDDIQQPGRIYAITQNGIYESLNVGMSWRVFNNTLPTNMLTDIIKDPYSDTLYVGTRLGIYKVFAAVVGVQEREKQIIPQTFSFKQNYPNPFNPATTIEYEVAQRAIIRITVHDGMGREVARLVDRERDPGVYQIQFDASELASGAYYCIMKSGSFSQTREMVFTK